MTWLPSYLADTRDLDVVRSGAFTAVPYAVAVVLGLLLGRVSDAYLRRSSAGIDARRRLIAGCLSSRRSSSRRRSSRRPGCC